ncbi:uncharacterized protein LOC112564405 isoform X2 [Pomacea canaliculata]|nr:uncharacterized protein LOC112564405 isoform X2 [Pomacea canaliculata]XP_025094980.1 uncharacterized protein LOC112564405 isoform X2 [Pomacea canaliculata]
MAMILFVGVIFLLTPAVMTADKQQQCVTYEAELQSRPDFTHKTVYQASILPPGFFIQSVKVDNKRPRSFYWCELKMVDMDGSMQVRRRFGHNGTHWWVEKGCGAWFFITGCPEGVVSIETSTPPAAESITETLPAGRPSKSQSGSLLNGNAIQSLINWITEESDNKIHSLLGAGPQPRVARSVNQEFEFNFPIRPRTQVLSFSIVCDWAVLCPILSRAK